MGRYVNVLLCFVKLRSKSQIIVILIYLNAHGSSQTALDQFFALVKNIQKSKKP